MSHPEVTCGKVVVAANPAAVTPAGSLVAPLSGWPGTVLEVGAELGIGVLELLEEDGVVDELGMLELLGDGELELLDEGFGNVRSVSTNTLSMGISPRS